MDYLELDNSAIQALTELGRDVFPSPVFTSPSPPTSDAACSARRRRFRRVQAAYLLRLEHPFSTPRDLANTIGLSRVPEPKNGSGDDGEALFCRLNQQEIDSFDLWAVRNCPERRFTRIPLPIAHKDAFELPSLGHDPTLPHHRPFSVQKHTVSEKEYPVPYFFYGTLADTKRLSGLFGVPESNIMPLKPASMLDGRLRTWGGLYRAIVDCPGERVDGFVYPITSLDEEDAIRAYETANYEVVKARIVLDGKEIEGRTFRFAGFEDELTG